MSDPRPAPRHPAPGESSPSPPRVAARRAARRRRDLGISVLYALVLVGILAGLVHPLRRHIESKRQDLLGRHESPGWRLAQAAQFGMATASGTSVRIIPGAAPLELADLPAQAVTLILGGFRGPYVVWLWVQAEQEKQANLHFDLIDRYTKIAALQSEYAEVWSDLGWNLAWNLSVQWHSLDRKYQWIRRAVEFLEEGNRKNPRNAEIMAALGRIYSEKLGRSEEAPYYRPRVRQDDGRSAFLIAYEWYDRARKANDRYGTWRGPLSPAANYSNACHNVFYYATELTQEAHDALKRSLDARQAADEPAAREAFRAGQEKLDEAIAAWTWARGEWQDHAVRFEREGIPSAQSAVYQRFYAEADRNARQLRELRSELTYENLPELFPRFLRPDLNF